MFGLPIGAMQSGTGQGQGPHIPATPGEDKPGQVAGVRGKDTAGESDPQRDRGRTGGNSPIRVVWDENFPTNIV